MPVNAAGVDDTDLLLLDLLRADARRTYSEMAGEVGLSVAAVKRRVDRLREIGVITGFTVQVDHAKLGQGVQAFIELRFLGNTRVSEIVRAVSTIPEVDAVFTLAGDPDALVQLHVRDLAHLQQVIDTLRRSGSVTGTRTLLVLGSWERRN
ncbi:Lrp/AsnC family transcriptional regulator [Pseudonocardia zijingensis]|uniref:Lrp/AsnC family transcriptional regulator n=1 Tax=Pseudonocardia zijingensis TaxID=153376 RepID=UPI0036131D1B